MNNLAHTMKSLCLIKKEKKQEMESGEYGRGYAMDGGNYGRQRRSATTGRYMDGGYNDYNDGGYGRMYRDDGKEQIRNELREAMRKAPDRQTRQALEEAMGKF